MLKIFLIIVLLTSCDLQTTDKTINYPNEDNVSLEIFFCPKENCSIVLENRLENANESIDCAFFDLNLKNIIDKLMEKSKEIDVRVLIDGNNYIELDKISKKETKSSYMHNKFCVIDSKGVITGSMNPTEFGSNRNNNALIIINSKLLANNYQIEFEELWEGIKGNKSINNKFILNNILYENYFCPEDCDIAVQRIINLIDNSNSSIDFMTFSFTHNRIANAILWANYKKNVSIHGIFESRNSGGYSKFKLFDYQKFKVEKDTNKGSMHQCVFW